MRKIIIRLALSLLIAGILIWWLLSQGVALFPPLDSIAEHTSLDTVLIYVGLFCVFHTIRAWRWSYLLKPFAKVAPGTMLQTAFTGFMAIQMMPLRTGEVARPYLLDKYTGVSKSALFGTIAIERVIDGLLVSICLTVALFAIPASASDYVWPLRLIPLSIFSVALVLLIAFHQSPTLVRRILQKIIGLVSIKVANFTVGVLDKFHGGLAALPSMKNFWAFTFFTILYWLINAVAFWLLATGLNLNLPFAGAVAGMGVLAVGILLPTGPGYFGNFQIAILISMAMYLPNISLGTTPTAQVSVFIFLLYALQTGLTILFGVTSGILLKLKKI